MQLRVLYFLALLLTVSPSPVSAEDTLWSEKKLGHDLLHADRAAQRNKWSRAIRYGEQMLAGSRHLDEKSDDRYISILKNLNRYYDKAGRLNEVAARVKEGYELSKEHLSPGHPTSLTSRNLYYKLLISRKNYLQAIPLVQENISVSEKDKPDHFRASYYMEQLAFLYSLTRQYEKEEATLTQLLRLNKKIMGKASPENRQIILTLAQNYCRQKKLNDFRELITQHQLKFYCKW